MPSQTPNNLLEELRIALVGLGIPAELRQGQFSIGKGTFFIEALERAHPTPAELGQLSIYTDADLHIVIADRLSETAKQVLRDQGIGWLDRRGHVRLWGAGLWIDSRFSPPDEVKTRSAPTRFSPAVREVAFAILMAPSERPSPRGLGAKLRRSPGYVSTILTGLAEDGFLDDDGCALLPDLFWALASAWPSEWTYLDDDPDVPRGRVPALTSGAHGAISWDAPLLIGPSETVYLEVADKSELRRVLSSARIAAHPSRARSAIQPIGRIAEVAEVNFSDETFTHPLLVALDLAVDARGRETLGSWRAKNRRLGLVATLEVFEHTGWIQENWIEEILCQPLDHDLWGAVARACWDHNIQGLAVIYQHPDTPEDVRSLVRARLEEYAGDSDYYADQVLLFAPSLATHPPFRACLEASEQPTRALERIRWEIARAFLDGDPRKPIRQAARDVISGELDANPWDVAGLAHYLLRLGPVGGLDSADIAALQVLAKRPAVDAAGQRWTEWSSGPEPPWMSLAEKAKTLRYTSANTLDEVLRAVRDLDLADQSIPLVELLAHTDGDSRKELLAMVEVSAQAISDLHIRAKVLAEASEFAPDTKRDVLLEAATVAGRAAVHQTSPSLLGGPEPGGIRGLLEVVRKLPGQRRDRLLGEIVELWSDWIVPNEADSRGTRRDRRMLFHHSGDDVLPLVRLLTEAGLTKGLRRVFETIRALGAEHGNALEGYLSMGAWPGLLDGDIEMAALYVAQARNPTAWARKYNSSDHESLPKPLGATFPDSLIGYENVWR